MKVKRVINGKAVPKTKELSVKNAAVSRVIKAVNTRIEKSRGREIG